MWFSKFVISAVRIAILKDIRALASLDSVDPLTFIFVTVLPLVDTVAVYFVFIPFTDIGVTSCTFPDAEALLDPHIPLTVVNFAVRPSIDALAVLDVVKELSDVSGSILEEFVTAPISLIILPLAFIDSSVVVNEHTKALSTLLNKCTLVQRILSSFDPEFVSITDLIIVKQLGDHLVVDDLLLLI